MNLNVTQNCPVCSLFYQSCREAVCYVDLAVPLTKTFKIRSAHIVAEERAIVALFPATRGYAVISSVHTNYHENGAFENTANQKI